MPVGRSGRWRVEHLTIPLPPEGFVDDRPVWAQDEPGTYTQLLCDDQLFMSDLYVEIHTQAPAIDEARQRGGRILITGLGLGLVIEAILAEPRPAVTEVVVVEQSPDVITLVEPYLRGRYGPLVRVVEHDALTYEAQAGEHFTVGWHDIWPSPQDPIATAQSHELIARFAPVCDWQGSWALVFLDEVKID